MEDKNRIIAEVKKKIGDAEIEEAIRELLGFLEKNSSYLNLHSDALQALSQYRKTKREAAQGIISYDQAKLSYNQVTNQVLNILEALQEEEKVSTPRKRRWPVIAGTLLLILAVAALGIWWFNREGKAHGEQKTTAIECPDFRPASAFSILLFPYYAPDLSPGKLDEEIPILMRTRFREFGNNNNLNIAPEMPTALPPRFTNQPARLFFSLDEAKKFADQCRARLVIWGAKESGPDERMKVTTRYKFIFPEQSDGFQMAQLALQENTEVQEITSPIKIATDGELTGSIEASIIQWFSGIIAHETGDYQTAVASLKGLEVPTDSAGLVRDMMLADSYLKMKDQEMAVKTYDEVLQQHPNYWLGLHNRGVLYLKKGDYQRAIQDLNRRIELNPNDVKSRFALGEAYLKTEQLQKARKEFEAAEEMPAKTPEEKKQLQPLIEKRLQTVNRDIERQKTIKRDAQQRLQQDPGNTQAHSRLIQADLKLGNTQAAVDASQVLLQRAPDKKEALKQLIDLYRQNNQTEAVQNLLKTAVNRNLIDSNQALELNRRLEIQPGLPERNN